MKKTLIILAIIAFALISCNREIIDNTLDENPASQTNIIFDLTANHPDGAATKAVKTGWESGDVIYVFFNNVAAPKYLKMSYDGSAWSTTQMNGATEESLGLAESATGTMRAVYLPFGNTLTVGADGTSFTFSETTYSYYLTATLDYTVTSGKVSGAFDMAIPDGYIQFFLDDASASSSTEIELREPHLTPQGIASVAADGTITHTTVASGAPLKGYVYDKAVKKTGESKGYLFSGILAAGARNTATDYNFTVVTGGWEGTYYAKAFTDKTWYRGESKGRALKMPALSGWTTITDYKPIDLGCDVGGKRIYWSSRNMGATADGPANSSTTYGNYYAWGETTSKTNYLWSTYAWGSAIDDLTKYNYDYNYGVVDGLTTLEPTDDAANVNLSLFWRMPTDAEWTALSNTTYFDWVWDNTNKGYTVTSRIAGYTDRNIFLPAAGSMWNNELRKTAEEGKYWSSSLGTTMYDEPSAAHFLWLQSSGHTYPSNAERYQGYSVRPVSE